MDGMDVFNVIYSNSRHSGRYPKNLVILGQKLKLLFFFHALGDPGNQRIFFRNSKLRWDAVRTVHCPDLTRHGLSAFACCFCTRICLFFDFLLFDVSFVQGWRQRSHTARKMTVPKFWETQAPSTGPRCFLETTSLIGRWFVGQQLGGRRSRSIRESGVF